MQRLWRLNDQLRCGQDVSMLGGIMSFQESSMRSLFAFVGLLVVSGVVVGQEAKTKAKKAVPNPAYSPVVDVAGLPRVLIIGDSISIGYQVPLREALKGKANVHRPGTNCGPTTRGVEQIEQWLGDGKWDVVHFNFGLH